MSEIIGDALRGQSKYQSDVERTADYIERFDILETINNVGNDEVFTPKRICEEMLDSLPKEVWSNPDYKWLNPCTKNGVFEREIALRLNEGLKDVILDEETRKKHILQKMIYSIGLTKFTAHVARRTLYYCTDANRQCDGIKAESDNHYVNGYAIGNGTWFDNPEGNILSPIADHSFKKNRCEYCGIKDDSKYIDPKQREQYAYEFIHYSNDELLKHLQDRFFEGDRSMKFDIIIGNPPYQLSDGGAQASAIPIYQKFIEKAKSLNPKYLCMIIQSRWMTAGKGLNDFRSKMLADEKIVLLHDYINSKEIFPMTEIKGGVCYFVRDRDYSGKCKTIRHEINENKTSVRFLKEEDFDIFIRYSEMISICKKIRQFNERSVAEIASPLKPYGLRGDVFKDPSKYNLPAFSDDIIDNGLTVYGIDSHQKRVVKYAHKNYPLPQQVALKNYKIFVPRNQGSGFFGEKFAEPILAGPYDICTETYIVLGPFNNVQERDNFYSYMKTKFFRALIGIRKQDPNASSRIYKEVPFVSLDHPWTDAMLYKKYGLTDEEIQFIEKHVEVMF